MIRSNNLLQFDTSWMRVRRQVRAVTLYLGYLGQRGATTKRTVNVNVFAVDSEILSPRWYNVSWDPNADVPVPGFSWRDAGIEPRLQRVGSFRVVLNQQKGMWTRSQYVPVRLDAAWFNRFLLTKVCCELFGGVSCDESYGFPNTVPFLHSSPLHVFVCSLCSPHSDAPTRLCCVRLRTRKPKSASAVCGDTRTPQAVLRLFCVLCRPTGCATVSVHNFIIFHYHCRKLLIVLSN